jgi:hypothetical protein
VVLLPNYFSSRNLDLTSELLRCKPEKKINSKMSQLFRKMRQQLFAGGQLPNLLLYVTGEIFFVVVGILVAFQVDNWTEERKLRREEIALLKSLKREMTDNVKQLKEVMSRNNLSRQAASKLLEIYHSDFQQFDPDGLDSLLAQVQWAWTFNPKLSVLNSIKVNGKIGAIQNPAIQEFIASFEEMADDSEEESLVVRSIISDKYVLAVSKYVSVSSRAKYLGFSLSKSKFQSDYKGVFNDREIESVLANIYIWRENEGKELNQLYQLLSKDILIVEKEIDQ